MLATNFPFFKKYLGWLLALILINLISYHWFQRFDLTHDKRYTLSKNTLEILKQINEPIFVDIFLEGKFPGDIQKLQTETKQLLEEFKAYNKNIQFTFVNPLEDTEDEGAIVQAFYEKGMTPINITVEDRGKQSQELVFPWAVAYSETKDTKIGLLKNLLGASTEEKVISSVQHLEYAFIQAFYTITTEKEKKIAVLKGNGNLEDVFIADALKTMRENYFIAPFTLDSVAFNPLKTLNQLKRYDLVLMAKPTQKFSEEEKLVLDQYFMHGGKGMFLLDVVAADIDSLYNETGTAFAYPREHNLSDFFFKYGIRINPLLIQDIQSTPITLATGEEGSQTQYQNYPWLYAPLVYPEIKHPIVHNVDGLKFDFVSPIDTLKNGIKKTILLKSSANARNVGVPKEISLEEVSEMPTKEDFANKGNFPVAVLLEGNFKSMYQNRILPFELKDFKDQSKETKIIVVSDGDVIKNQLDRNYQPLELGYDKWTKNIFGNKEFILNSINYLLNNNGLIEVRNKEVDLALLNRDKVYENYHWLQAISLLIPLFLVAIFGVFITWRRKAKHQTQTT